MQVFSKAACKRMMLSTCIVGGTILIALFVRNVLLREERYDVDLTLSVDNEAYVVRLVWETDIGIDAWQYIGGGNWEFHVTLKRDGAKVFGISVPDEPLALWRRHGSWMLLCGRGDEWVLYRIEDGQPTECTDVLHRARPKIEMNLVWNEDLKAQYEESYRHRFLDE